MRTCLRLTVVALCAACACFAADPALAPEGIPKHQEAQIRAAAPAKARVTPKKQRRVLVFSTPAHLMNDDPHKGYCVPYGMCAMRVLGEETGAFTPVVSDDIANFLPEKIAAFDAIVLNNTCGAWIRPSAEAMPALKAYGETADAVEKVLRKSLLEYVERGGGIVAYHFAAGGNRQWPEFAELLGATFTGHPWNEEVGVRNEDPANALVAAFGGKDFRIADEIYEFGPPYDRAKVRVLLSIDTRRTNMGVRWINRTDGDFAQAWVKPCGKGRVFYTGFGHRTELFWNPALLQFYLDAIQFATGDLEAPTAPRADRPVNALPGPTPPEVRAAKMRAGQVPEPSAEEIRKIEAAAPDTAPAKPAKPRKVLVWGHAWTHLPNPYAEKAIEILGRKTGAFQAVVSDDPRLLLGDRLPQFDALVMNNIHEPQPFRPADFAALDAQEKTAARQLELAVQESILKYVRDGAGIVGTHAATAALGNWAEYGVMMGGFYGNHITQEVTLGFPEPAHPVVACFEGKPFTLTDEVYIFREPYSRKSLRIVAALDLSRMPDPGKRADKDYAVSWVRAYEKGRVFYTTLGHMPETHWNALFLRHLLAGIQFALGDLPAEASPRE